MAASRDPRLAGADRQQRRGRRRVSARVRRRRAVAALLALLVVVVAGWLVARPGGGAGPKSAAGSPKRALSPAQAVAAPGGPPAAEAGLLPWQMAAPISREVVVAGSPGRLVVLGGLTAGGASASGVYALRTATGAVRQIGALSAPLHDAAAGLLGGRALVFGGGSSATVATVQAFPLAGPGSGTTTATTAGSMPAPRSDAAAVTIGATTYVVGGYDGSRPDAPVLATTNGRTFTTVAALPVPVRYPAVAALGGQIFVFGGQAITGPHAGAPLDAIQAVDPARHTAAVIGHLPEPLAGAAAMTVGNPLGEDHLVLRPSRPSRPFGRRSWILVRARRRLSAQEQPDHGG
ncbi:MAG TPA: kelch repeat-containing protein [Streptosporangiaceae bacterium]|nr:kelch repeat-containing protein [Streptosporangiaceae bacterium]